MYQLIATVLAISLASFSLAMSVNYVNPVAVQAQELSKRFEQSFLDLKKGRDQYVAAHTFEPDELPEITPNFVFLPPAPTGMVWSLGAGGVANEGRYFCLSGEASPAALRAIERLGSVFSPQAYFVSEACGSISSSIPEPGVGGKTAVAATLWVRTYS